MDDPFIARNLTYGVQDSLISTTGVVAGMSLAGLKRREILVTGLILVIVEAMSMSFGSFISEESFVLAAGMQHTVWDIVKYATVMLVSYVLAGGIPLLPFLLDIDDAWQWSVALALATLFVLIMYVQGDPNKAGTLTSVGGSILAVSILSGRALKV